MNKKIIYALVILAFVFFVTSLLIFIKSGEDTTTEEKPVTQIEKKEETIAKPPIKAKAFFFTEGSRLMQPVKDVDLEASLVEEERYKTFIQILLKGEEKYILPVPDGVELRTLFLIKKQSILVLDFNEMVLTNFPAGTTSEMEFIYFFVNNICYNFPEIKRVKFMISGNEYRTISGHLDIENPFYPDFSLLREE